MRWLVARALRKEGYDVVELADGERLRLEITTRILQKGELDVELIVTDVRMPGRDGLELVETLAAAALRVPIIVMTAFSDDDARRRTARIGATLFDKPFALDDLRDAALRLAPPRR